MKSLKTILILTCLPLFVFATGQVGDILIYQEDTLVLFSNPLEKYLDSKTNRTINGYELNMTSTACYRGYQATWEIINDSLFLTKIQIGCYGEDPKYFDLKKEFNTMKVFASWLSGNIIAPKGQQIHYVHSDYESIYESEVVLSFQDGILTNQIIYDNSKSYKSIFTKNRDSLQNFIYKNIDWQKIPDLKDKSERVFIILTSGKSIKPDSIHIGKPSKVIVINEEALKIGEMLPEWDIYYKKGKVIKVKWTIPVVFDEQKRKKYAR
jgi:hypothetical protein